MTLDDLIERLQWFRVQHPGAGTAMVHCPVELDPWYALGEVQLGFEWEQHKRAGRRQLRKKPERVH